MYPKLLSLYGPFELNSFNALIMLGLGVFMKAALSHPQLTNYITKQDFINTVLESTFAGILGGRLLHVLSDWQNYDSLVAILSIWKGGLSILGALIGVLAYSSILLLRKGIAPLAVYDIAAVYIPLIHAIARIGCFLTGCCYGMPSTRPWAITYTNPLVVAPLHIKMHPTQLYSSFLYLLLFFILHRMSSSYKIGTGMLCAFYIMGMSLERFVVDFFRGDRIMVADPRYSALSFHQWIALALFVASCCTMLYLHRKQARACSHA